MSATIAETDLPDTLTVIALTPFVGAPTAVMLSLLGYKTLEDIAAAAPGAIRTLPHIGAKRFDAIKRCLKQHGLSFTVRDLRVFTLEGDWSTLRNDSPG